jgi:hypothetical protein
MSPPSHFPKGITTHNLVSLKSRCAVVETHKLTTTPENGKTGELALSGRMLQYRLSSSKTSGICNFNCSKDQVLLQDRNTTDAYVGPYKIHEICHDLAEDLKLLRVFCDLTRFVRGSLGMVNP